MNLSKVQLSREGADEFDRHQWPAHGPPRERVRASLLAQGCPPARTPMRSETQKGSSVNKITPLATVALPSAQRACSVHVVTVASHSAQGTGGAALLVIVIVVLFVMVLVRTVRRVTALIGTIVQLAAAVTSAIVMTLIAAMVAAALLIH